MNDDILKGKWAQLKGKVKEQWGKLTDDEIDSSTAVVNSWSAKCRSGTASPANRRHATSTTGSTTSPPTTRFTRSWPTVRGFATGAVGRG